MLPVAIWPVPGDLRNAVLAGRLLFAVAIDDDVWLRAMSEEGLDWQRTDNDRWKVRDARRELDVDAVEVAKLELGFAFAGLSPRAVSQAVRDSVFSEPA